MNDCNVYSLLIIKNDQLEKYKEENQKLLQIIKQLEFQIQELNSELATNNIKKTN